jgi:uncharacterized SAM-binding protein YcdF (DUF218 family)
MGREIDSLPSNPTNRSSRFAYFRIYNSGWTFFVATNIVKKKNIDLQKRLLWKRWKRWLKFASIAAVGFIILSLAVNLAILLPANASKPVDAILVLGGSIRREIYVAELANRYPDLPILISQGSKDPCIFLLFQKASAPKNKVWLEKCANSTFDNFFFSVPILKGWGAQKVRVVTSPSHLPRAEWLAKIHLFSRGMAVEMDSVREIGVPGNRESKLKTSLDIARSLIWAVVSQVISPPCWDVVPLSSVDLDEWRQEGFECERQGRIP